MSNIECLTPYVLSSEQWGTAAKGRTLNLNKTFGAVVVAPDSEASEFELRPNGQSSFRERILVSRHQPYFGALHAKGLGVFPTVECPSDSLPNAKYSHFAKLLFYPAAPPFISSTRAPLRKLFAFGNADNLNSATVIAPLIPTFGRDRIFLAGKIDISGSGDVDLTFEGGHCSPIDVVDTARVTERWQIPTNASANVWPEESAGVDWDTLQTQNVTADGSWFYQYEGSFDFIRVTAVHNSGSWAWNWLHALAIDKA